MVPTFYVLATCGLRFPVVPYGPDQNDHMLRKVDDGYSPQISLSPPIPLFGGIESRAYVSTIIEFDIVIMVFLQYISGYFQWLHDLWLSN